MDGSVSTACARYDKPSGLAKHSLRHLRLVRWQCPFEFIQLIQGTFDKLPED
jgi:hypothetical protein